MAQHSTSLLARLPAVVVQCVMQSLDHRDIVALAGSCKYAMACADSSFAWLHCPVAEFSFRAITPSFKPSRLRLRSPMRLLVDFARATDSDIDRIVEFAASAHVVTLCVDIREFAGDGAARLFSNPAAFRWLKEIDGLSPTCEAEMTAVASLPALTALDFTGDSSIDAALLAPLERAAGLRSLYVSDAASLSDSCLPAIMRLTQLRMLCLYEPQLVAGNFDGFCAAMSALRELWLQSWDAAGVGSASHLAAGLRLLESLLTLQCDNLTGYEALLPAVAAIPSLGRLVLLESDFPSGLDVLMQAAPALRLELRPYGTRGNQSALEQKPSLTPFADRLTITLDEDEPRSEPTSRIDGPLASVAWGE